MADGTERGHRGALPADLMVDGFKLRGVLGVGGFGITYLAEDRLERLVAIKEYFPTELAVRDGLAVHVKSEKDRDYFIWGRERFLDEAKLLARFEHPNIIRVLHYTEANNTAYFVMAYETGHSLRDHLSGLGRAPTEYELRAVVMPLLDGLKVVHAAGVLHRDIKPSNILIRPNLSPVLIDFGAARLALGLKERSLTTVVTPGYSPVEQYHRHGDQGPWTDFYALGAVLYRAVTGQTPVEATQRVETVFSRDAGDPLPGLAATAPPGFSRPFLEAIDWSLQLKAVDRPQSVDAWRDGFNGVNRAAAPPAADDHAPTQVWEPTELVADGDTPGRAELPDWAKRPRIAAGAVAETASAPPRPLEPAGGSAGRRLPLIGGVLAALLVAAGGAWFLLSGTSKAPPPLPVRTAESAPESAPAPVPTFAPTPAPTFAPPPRREPEAAPAPAPALPAPPPQPALVAPETCDFLAAAPGQGFGEGVPFDRLSGGEAITACTKAVAAHPGVARFEVWLGRAHRRVGADHEAALHFERAAVLGDAYAQFNYGYLLQNGRGVPKNEGAAALWYRKAADQGNDMAANNLGILLKRGAGVGRDDAEAVRWFRSAADRGLADAANNLGLMLAEGRGAPRDEAEALRWYRMAADQGFADAANNLGFMLEHGRGAPRDEVEALRWYRAAADAGSAVAQNNLGLMLADGRGAAKAEEEAVHWFRMAAAQDLPAGESNLAQMLLSGHGTARDEAEALRWFRKAAARGFEPARQTLKRLGASEAEPAR